jgi:photosystem II stability/assembly factor-like uncharacterized protein
MKTTRCIALILLIMNCPFLLHAQWVQLTPPGTGNFTSISFPSDSLTGFTLSNNKIYKTVDGGNSWTICTSANLAFLYFLNNDTGFAVGSANSMGLIIKTTDGGNSWNTNYTGNYDYNYIVFKNSDTGYCIGNNTIVKTVDGGNSWNDQTFGFSCVLNSVHFVDSVTGVAVGGFGGIIKTSDGGSTWNTISSNSWGSLMSTCFLNKDTAFIAGYGLTGMTGTVLPILKRSTNGGQTWTSISSGGSNYLYKIIFTENKIGYLVGSGGQIIRSADHGNTWQSIPSNTTAALYDIFFLDSLNGYISGSGVILKTSNGGLTWLEEKNSVHLNIFPNPSSENISIQLNQISKVETLVIRDIQGKCIFRKEIKKETNFIEISLNEPPGIYFMELETGLGMLRSKIVLE